MLTLSGFLMGFVSLSTPINNFDKLKMNTVESRFLEPSFLEPPDNSNQLSFPLDLLHSNTVILDPISRTLETPANSNQF